MLNVVFNVIVLSAVLDIILEFILDLFLDVILDLFLDVILDFIIDVLKGQCTLTHHASISVET